MTTMLQLFLYLMVCHSAVLAQINARDYGVYVGALRTLAHAVSGDVHIASETHLGLVNFNYDGTGPGV